MRLPYYSNPALETGATPADSGPEPANASAPAPAPAAAGAPAPATAPPTYGGDLAILGGWSATRWQYTAAADPKRSVDVVCDLGGSVALSFSGTSFILAYDIPGRGSHSMAGTFRVEGGDLLLTPQGAEPPPPPPERVRFRQSGRTLSLQGIDSEWAFGGNTSPEDAEFVAVLVRL